MYWVITRDVSYLETIERILCKFSHFDRDSQIYLIDVYLEFFFLYTFFYSTLHVHGAKFFVVVRQNVSFSDVF